MGTGSYSAEALQISADGTELTVSDGTYTFNSAAFMCRGVTMLPIDILGFCGITAEYSEDTGSVTLTGAAEAVLDQFTDDSPEDLSDAANTYKYFTYNNAEYITIYTYNALTDLPLWVSGELPKISVNVRECNTDRYRAKTCVNVNDTMIAADGRVMESVSLSDETVADYVDILNEFKSTLPEVNIYSMVVPPSASFYAPRQYAANHITAIRAIYSSLGAGVTPVDVIPELFAHADEDIYFKADHHWTQRGAYYAYKAFAEVLGRDMPAIDKYEVMISEDFTGSLSSVLEENGEESEETIERFSPRSEVEIKVYDDMYMERFAIDTEPFNLRAKNYSTFLLGDAPLTYIKTNAGTGRKLAIIKDSYANAFAIWAAEDYDEIYIVDPRDFDVYNDEYPHFDLGEFYKLYDFDDLLVLNYSVSLASPELMNAMHNMA